MMLQRTRDARRLANGNAGVAAPPRHNQHQGYAERLVGPPQMFQPNPFEQMHRGTLVPFCACQRKQVRILIWCPFFFFVVCRRTERGERDVSGRHGLRPRAGAAGAARHRRRRRGRRQPAPAGGLTLALVKTSNPTQPTNQPIKLATVTQLSSRVDRSRDAARRLRTDRGPAFLGAHWPSVTSLMTRRPMRARGIGSTLFCASTTRRERYPVSRHLPWRKTKDGDGKFFFDDASFTQRRAARFLANDTVTLGRSLARPISIAHESQNQSAFALFVIEFHRDSSDDKHHETIEKRERFSVHRLSDRHFIRIASIKSILSSRFTEFSGFYLVFIGFYLVLPSFTGFYLVLLGFT